MTHIRYEGDIYRPPSEAYSLLIQATVGCSYNKCAFCALYSKKKFRVRSREEIFADLDTGRKLYGRVEKLFFCDGDALCLSTQRLSEMLDYSRKLFPECRQISVYGNARDVLGKGIDDLRSLAEKGLGIIYIGAESGSDTVLKDVNKGSSGDDIAKAIRMIEEAGIKASVTFISGLGGRKYMEEHARESGRLVSETAPSYFSLLTLILTPEMPLYSAAARGDFIPLSTGEVIKETEIFFENIRLPESIEYESKPGNFRKPECIFRSNHVSNALVLKGTFPEDRDRLIETVRAAEKYF